MKLSDGLTIIAILLAPVAAVQVQIWLEQFRTYSRRQHEVFRMLMATRGTRLSAMHIDALNRIDLEFYGRRGFFGGRRQTPPEKRVIEAWRAYHSNLGDKVPEGDRSAFYQKRWDLFMDLIYTISQACGYDFDRTHLQEMSYSPVHFETVEKDNDLVRMGLAAVLSGKQPLSVGLVFPPEAIEKQGAVQDAILKQIGPEGILRVRVVSDR